MSRRNALPLLALTLAALMDASPAFAQSTELSQVSAVSMEPSEAAAAVVAQSLQAGSQLVVTAIRPVGDAVEVSVETAGQTSATVLKIGSDTVRIAGLSVGVALAVTATEAGWLICKGSEVVAFVPDRLARSLTHHREL